MRTLIFLITISFLYLGCGKNPINSVEPDVSGNIVAKVGDTIQIKILNKASDGGYRYNITTDFDSSIARFINFSSEYTGGPNIEGAPTNDIWKYLALKKGSTTLILKLYRYWEPDTIIDTKIFMLVIQ